MFDLGRTEFWENPPHCMDISLRQCRKQPVETSETEVRKHKSVKAFPALRFCQPEFLAEIVLFRLCLDFGS